MNWFEKIFSVSPEMLRQGQLTFIGRISPQVLVLVLAVLLLGVWFAYRLVTSRVTTTAWRTVLALRLVLVIVLLFLLADPAMRWVHGRQEVFTAVLVDTLAVDGHRRC